MIAAHSPTETARRNFFAARFPAFWATVERFPYALLATQPLTAEQLRALHAAAERLYAIFARVMPVLQALPSAQLADMGIPERAHDIVRLTDACASPTVFARFDFALTADGPKMLEVNAETPFLLWESHAIAGAVAQACGYEDPNLSAESILRAGLAAAMREVSQGDRVVVTALNTWREDWFTAKYLATQLDASSDTRPPVDLAPTSELRVARGKLYDDRGPIDVLWRMYPLEHFANDPDGARFCDLIATGRLRVLNPPSALLMQSKATQAIVWGMHRAGAFFTAEEHADIERYVLPSTMDAPDDRAWKHVRKPVFGREGNSVEIVENGTLIGAASHRTYAKQPMLYQEFVDLPRIAYVDPVTEQPEEGFGVYTVFVVGGAVSAMCLRVGDRITDAWAHMLALRIAEA